MRALGVDLGTKRVGLAISDTAGSVATPIDTVVRGPGHRNSDLAGAIQASVDEWEAEIVVVGMPISLDGRPGPAARDASKAVSVLRDTLTVPVVSYDERLTTVTAERSLMNQGISGRDRRQVVDRVAAAVILQSWLDAGCPRGS